MKRLTRAQAAVAALLTALVSMPAGAALLWGPGAGLLLLGALLLMVALLLGWNA